MWIQGAAWRQKAAAAGRPHFVGCILHIERRIIEEEAARTLGINGRDKKYMNRPFEQLVWAVLEKFLWLCVM
jgi:hypothetical protein